MPAHTDDVVNSTELVVGARLRASADDGGVAGAQQGQAGPREKGAHLPLQGLRRQPQTGPSGSTSIRCAGKGKGSGLIALYFPLLIFA